MNEQVVISFLDFAFHWDSKKTRFDEKNMYLFVLNRHNSHVTFEVVKLTVNFGLDIISLPSHISHALQPLDVSYFKPFKFAFMLELSTF
jgi:hypothetical protein